MLENLQNVAIFQKFQFDNLVDFEKCCKTHIFLQKSVPIQPKTSNMLPKFCSSSAKISARRTRCGRPTEHGTSTGTRARALRPSTSTSEGQLNDERANDQRLIPHEIVFVLFFATMSIDLGPENRKKLNIIIFF